MNIGIPHFFRLADFDYFPVAQEHRAITIALDSADIMTHEDDCASHIPILGEFLQALALEIAVPHGEDFVHKEDVAVGVDRDAEGEADLHTATVIFEFLVDEAFEFGEAHDIVEFGVDLLLGEAEHGGIEVDIVAAGEFGVEADAQLEEG